MTLLQNLPDWIYMLIGTIVFVVPAFIYLVAKGSAGKSEGFGSETDLYTDPENSWYSGNVLHGDM